MARNEELYPVGSVPAGGYIQAAIEQRRKDYQERNLGERPTPIITPGQPTDPGYGFVRQRMSYPEPEPTKLPTAPKPYYGTGVGRYFVPDQTTREAYGRGGLVGAAGSVASRVLRSGYGMMQRAEPYARAITRAPIQMLFGSNAGYAAVPDYTTPGQTQAAPQPAAPQAAQGQMSPSTGAAQPVTPRLPVGYEQPGPAQPATMAPQYFGGAYAGTPGSISRTRGTEPATTQQQRTPGMMNQVMDASGRVRYQPMQFDRFGRAAIPDIAGGYVNGVPVNLRQTSEIPSIPTGQLNQDFISQQSKYFKRGNAVGADLFQTEGSAAAARQAEQRLQIQNQLRNFRGTNAERSAYQRQLESLQGPAEQERRKQESAQERIARASNPPDTVRGEKPDAALERAKSDLSKRLIEDRGFTPGSATAVDQIVGALESQEEMRQFSVAMSLAKDSKKPEERKTRRDLFRLIASRATTDIAQEIVDLSDAEMAEYQKEEAARKKPTTPGT